MSKKLIISEDERRHILGLYGLLNEVETSTSAQDLTLDKRIEFGPGHYGLSSGGAYQGRDKKTYNWNVDADLKEGLNKIKEFLKNNPTGYIVGVTLESGESQIPNDDALKGGADLKSGELSDLRLQTLKNYLTPIFESWKSEGINTEFTIKEDKKPGETKWKGSPFCPENATDEQARGECFNEYVKILADSKNPKYNEVVQYRDKYNTEQYFRVVISVNKTEGGGTSIETNCAAGLKIRIYVPSHSCQNAEFFVFANNTLLYNSVGGMTVNLNTGSSPRGIPRTDSEPIFDAIVLNPGYGYLKNGDGTYGNYGYGVKNDDPVGGERSDTFTITPEQSQEIVSKGNGLIKIWLIATTSTAHKDIVYVTITKDGIDEPIYDDQPNIVQGNILTLNACGTEVLEEGTDATVPELTSYILALKDEKTAIMNQVISSGDEETVKNISKRKQEKLDGKAVLLERIDVLNQNMSNLVIFLGNLFNKFFEPSLKGKQKPLSNDVYNQLITRLNEDYTKFYNELNKVDTEETPVVDLKRKSDMVTYVDKSIRNDKLYGDVRDELDKFYKDFDGIYFNTDTGQYSPNGSMTDMKKDWGKLYYSYLRYSPNWIWSNAR
jgi:hypothetical protein